MTAFNDPREALHEENIVYAPCYFSECCGHKSTQVIKDFGKALQQTCEVLRKHTKGLLFTVIHFFFTSHISLCQIKLLNCEFNRQTSGSQLFQGIV